MAQIITTGPAHIFIGRVATELNIATSGLDDLEYLGTCQSSPELSVETLKEDVMNDIGGGVPISFTHQGQKGEITLLLNRFDEAVYAKLSSGVYGPGSRGEISRSQMGGLAQGMGMDFDILFYFPFHAQLRPSGTGLTSLPEGIHFTSVVPEEEDILEMGTRAVMVNIKLKAIPKMYFSTTNADSNGVAGPTTVREFVLYNHILSVSAALKAKVN